MVQNAFARIKSVYVELIVVGKRVLMIEVSDLARERVKSETSINDLIKKKSWSRGFIYLLQLGCFSRGRWRRW